MSGEHDKLRDTLNRLQIQLDELRTRDPAAAAHLQATVDEAKNVLAGASTEMESHESLVERLSGAVLQYEASHPILSGGLGRIVDALAQMGI